MNSQTKRSCINLVLVVLLTILVMSTVINAISILGADIFENTWAASTEFSELSSGQDRFSEHKTNVPHTFVIVDHDTGIQYLSNRYGMTVLLEEDGTPKRVAKTG